MFVFAKTPNLTRAARAAFGVTLCFLCLANLYYSQTPTPTAIPSPTPPPIDLPPVSPTFDRPVRPMPSAERVGVDISAGLPLTLQQAIEMALKNNNDIDASRDNSRINDFNLLGARGVYDPLLTSENYYESLTTPTASAIGGAVNGACTLKRCS